MKKEEEKDEEDRRRREKATLVNQGEFLYFILAIQIMMRSFKENIAKKLHLHDD